MHFSVRMVRLSALALLLTLVGSSGMNAGASAPPAVPWAFTTSANTDPRLGLVAVDGPEEGGQFAAVCSGTTLYKARAGQEIGEQRLTVEAQTSAEECRSSDAATTATPAAAGASRMINTDPAVGWVVMPVPGPSYEQGGELNVGLAAICSGGTGVTFTLVQGLPAWQMLDGVRDCASAPIM